MSLAKQRSDFAMCMQTFILLSIYFLTLDLVTCVKINRLEVPEVAHLGTPIVLDCDYSVERDEGLVVKWFFNDRKTLIYQWIPHTKPVTLGVLKGRVNLDYSASSDINSIHRALQITKPGPDLSGNYTCAVSSYFSEDRKTKSMLIVDPGKSLELKQEFHENGNRKIICSAEGVFPQPSMNIHINNSEVNNSVFSVHKRAGLFDVQVMADVPLLTSPKNFPANYIFHKPTSR
ncbi:hypothetical protein WA026_023101 [Henosepilachna vigintioctopunctata]|uniref:Ig-like domain-containing protein n=1 Tax=Henosepilachna vigintioctopunctata TaxID=420089 RepID=A0AAW1U4L6_9CUCU